MIKEVNNQELLDSLGKGSKVQLLVFFAEWCGPCKMYKQALDQFDSEYNIDILRVNIDKEKELSMQHRVMNIPLTKVFVDGKELETIVGYKPIDELNAVLSKYL